MLFQPETNRTHRRIINYMQAIADKNGFEFSLEESHANRASLVAVWDMAQEVEAVESPANLERLKELAYHLVWESKLGEMMGCLHREPKTEEEMEQYRRMFNHGNHRLDYEDVKWSDVEATVFNLDYEVHSDDESVLKLQPNTQLHLWETNEI